MPTPEFCASCAEEPNALLLQGIALFNQREYFACHEVLEHAWNAERRGIRTFYKGILQVGVGAYHLLRQNYRGAIIKLESGANYLLPYAPICQQVAVDQLIADAHRLRAAVIAHGPEHTLEVDRSLLPIIQLVAME